MEVNVEKAILHILDTNSTMPVLSQRELELDTDIANFITKHTNKLCSDQATKEAVFLENSEILEMIKTISETSNSFVTETLNIATTLFQLMLKHVDILPADLLIAITTIDDVEHLVIYKFNYKESYTHYVINSEQGVYNQIIKYKTLFPSEGQKIDEGVIINLDTWNIKLVEKAYEIDGEKRCYFSQLFLKCTTNLSPKESLKVIHNIAQEISRKYNGDEFQTITKIKSAVYESSEETSEVQLENIAMDVFGDSIHMQKEYLVKVKQAGVTDTLALDETYAEKHLNTHKIKTDTGIELKFPLKLYKNKDLIEFINNPDGTTSILIKNISRIINT